MTTTAVLFQVGSFSQVIDGVDQERLLIDRIGIPRVTILISRSLQKANRRKIPRHSCSKEILQVILMIGRTIIADFRQRRTRVRRVQRWKASDSCDSSTTNCSG